MDKLDSQVILNDESVKYKYFDESHYQLLSEFNKMPRKNKMTKMHNETIGKFAVMRNKLMKKKIEMFMLAYLEKNDELMQFLIKYIS